MKAKTTGIFLAFLPLCFSWNDKCIGKKCAILSSLHSEKMQYYANLPNLREPSSPQDSVRFGDIPISEDDPKTFPTPVASGTEQIDFMRLKTFFDKLGGAKTNNSSSSSLENIKSNIQKMNVFEKASTRPPYVFQEVSAETSTTLPPSKLASMVGVSTPSTFSLFKPVLDQLGQKLANSKPAISTTTTAKPFSMPSYFGSLLAQESLMDDTTETPTAPPTIESTESVKDWYMQHMSQVLSSSGAGSTIKEPTKLRPTTRPQLVLPGAAFFNQPSSSVEENETPTKAALIKTFEEEPNVCPTQCQCVCPTVEMSGSKDDQIKKVNLDITLLPCARTAAYQLELAIKLCRRK